jgi:hypothetical protein
VRVGKVLVRDPARATVWQLDEPTEEAGRDAIASAGLSASQPLPNGVFGSAPLEQELDAVSAIPWDLYQAGNWQRLELFAQRGCLWGRCTFCALRENARRAMSPAKVVDTVAAAIENGVRIVSFADDFFAQDRAWTRAVVQGLEGLGNRATYVAQTMATRTLWPHLRPMQRAGFRELSLGVETLDPDRAVLMAKTLNGHGYVDQAKETVYRTAAAGIYPVIYVIMVDPASTLLGVAREQADLIAFIADVYRRTSILPKLSYSLMMLPLAGTPMTEIFAHRTTSVALKGRTIELPAQYELGSCLVGYLTRVGALTETLRYRRENLAAFGPYFGAAMEAAEACGDPDLPEIRDQTERGLACLRALIRDLDQDIDETLDALLRLLSDDEAELQAPARFDYRRFGGYISGIQHYHRALNAALENGRD